MYSQFCNTRLSFFSILVNIKNITFSLIRNNFNFVLDSNDSNDFYDIKEPYDYDKVEEVGILKGVFKLDEDEEEIFDGDYKSKFIKNKHFKIIDLSEIEWNIPCQIVYSKGRVMYKSNIEDPEVNIFDLIDLFIKYTFDPCKDLDLDKSIAGNKQMRFGTICPTRKRLFVYKNREFTAYGRYIFGYDHGGVKIKNDKTTVKFRNPPLDDECYEYVYSFMIRNHTTQVVEAFGLYR